ncbi:MAG TPA: nicotinate (nicotinamide) nucleotide adenylyltransferase [Persephonella sp.]|uniref:Probable nicotinate-nucleotide adenylyltransferase n=1 Tax=Persephonella marina (strain DSM 14350 / EX-H1) TaxID=123214 RepID=C0QRD6_PERMH|nr:MULTISPECIES: nicotinate (nicotinamide) nucleotide adenylyltransferase [Persephonella]ACO03791.1 nicotinate-nucleotide adenylyltransferase [Persephonella marina EX-H1]HCB68978.1 nicotinate (nicotinamide) nucleotide adenylyltransferase [Persephonella sp.]
MIALYGGSFDPVHIGHLRIAEDIREFFSLSKIIFIPAYHSPLKPECRASAEDRIEMLRLSLRYNSYFEIDDLEIKRKGKSYTIDTVKVYREKTGYYPSFIVGTDAFLTLKRWKDPEKLLESCSFIVVGRGKDTKDQVNRFLKENFQKTITESQIIEKEKTAVYFYDTRRIDISSTEIRQRVKENRSIKYLVLPEVEEYIFKKKLYRG